MISQALRTAILQLHQKKIGTRKIAKTLQVARSTVQAVIRSQSEMPKPPTKPRKAEPHRDEILRLYTTCKGNLVRVHEELLAQNVEIAYPTLTAFCRQEKIGTQPKRPSGRYHFEPGQEMQHDTSPHRIRIGEKQYLLQTASAVLCHSRMLFAQCYPRFRRLECKTFLSQAMQYFGGATRTVMIDNTHLVVLRGSGAQMVPVPEMEIFSERFGFTFRAHEKGDANRSARVERNFWYFETNFLAGRTFTSLEDLNQQARQWCEKVNHRYKRSLRARPVELYASERTQLYPLPLWIPEPYLIHHRIVDVERYVTVATQRYSVPSDWIGRSVQVRESHHQIQIELPRSQPVIHPKISLGSNRRSTLPEHRFQHRPKHHSSQPCREEVELTQKAPELVDYIAALKQHKRVKISTTLALRQLLRMVREYPREPLLEAVARAHHYGLYDLQRLESMVLRAIASDYFRLDPDKDPGEDT